MECSLLSRKACQSGNSTAQRASAFLSFGRKELYQPVSRHSLSVVCARERRLLRGVKVSAASREYCFASTQFSCNEKQKVLSKSVFRLAYQMLLKRPFLLWLRMQKSLFFSFESIRIANDQAKDENEGGMLSSVSVLRKAVRASVREIILKRKMCLCLRTILLNGSETWPVERKLLRTFA